MQLLGFTLATKQPSMTAATLADAIGEGARDRSGCTSWWPRRRASCARSWRGHRQRQHGVAGGGGARLGLRTGAPGTRSSSARQADYVLHSLHPLQQRHHLVRRCSPASSCGPPAWPAAGWRTSPSTAGCPRPSPSTAAAACWARAFMRWLSELFARNISGCGGQRGAGVDAGHDPGAGQVLRRCRSTCATSRCRPATLALALARAGLADGWAARRRWRPWRASPSSSC